MENVTKDELRSELGAFKTDIRQLIDGLSESLSREIGGIRRDMNDGFNRVESRLTKHGGILSGGGRQVARLISWSEEMDMALIERDARIAELTRRIDRLEGR